MKRPSEDGAASDAGDVLVLFDEPPPPVANDSAALVAEVWKWFLGANSWALEPFKPMKGKFCP